MTFSFALCGHRKFRQGVRGWGGEWCPGSECFVDIELLIFYRGERRSMPKNLYTVREVGHHWPMAGLPGKHHLNVNLLGDEGVMIFSEGDLLQNV